MILLALIGTIVGVPIGIWLGDLFMKALLSVFEFDMVYTLNWKLPTMMAIIIGLLFPVVFSLFPIYSAGKTSILLSLKCRIKRTHHPSGIFLEPLLVRYFYALCL